MADHGYEEMKLVIHNLYRLLRETSEDADIVIDDFIGMANIVIDDFNEPLREVGSNKLYPYIDPPNFQTNEDNANPLSWGPIGSC